MGTILSVIPPILCIGLALWTKNIIVSLFIGILVGSVIINGINFLPPIIDEYMTNGLKSNTNVLICLILIGIMLQFIKRAGGFKAFGAWCRERVNTPRQTLIYTFWFSMLFSVATNLGSISIPRVMKGPALQNNMPLAKVTMVVASVVNAASSLLPFTNYILFFSGLIVSSVEGYDGYSLFIQCIPFQFFGILSIITSGLYAYGIIPDIGPIKRLSENQITSTTNEGSSDSDIEVLGGPDVVSDIFALIVPFGALIVAIPLFSFIKGGLVVTSGILVGTITSVIYATVRKRVKFSELTGGFAAGFREIGMVFLILLFAFTFGQIVTTLGFSAYVIGLLGDNFNGGVIPMVTFLMCCLIAYTTGSLSAAAVIVFPLGLPLALAAGINIPLTIGACISGAHFGDLFSPISDSVILPSESMGISPVETSRVLVPYRLIQLVICAVVFLICGYVL